jgi:hypothetical protein
MQKNILVIYYSQTGQLKEIVNKYCLPFETNDCTVEYAPIVPEEAFTFPWSSESFFSVMPECVLGIPVKIKPFQFKLPAYDLVVFAYQPWFLSPSLPAISALKDSSVLNIMKGANVLTLIGARNMWLSSQERVKEILANNGSNLVGNIVMTDRHNNYISAATILHWMLDGKKDRLWGIFPMPGVSQKDMDQSPEFGTITLEALNNNTLGNLQTNLVHKGAVTVISDFMFIEGRATKLFSMWANLIIKKKNRSQWLVLYKYYLIIALFIVAPIVVTINGILFQPFLGGVIAKKKKYYLGLN